MLSVEGAAMRAGVPGPLRLPGQGRQGGSVHEELWIEAIARMDTIRDLTSLVQRAFLVRWVGAP